MDIDKQLLVKLVFPLSKIIYLYLGLFRDLDYAMNITADESIITVK
jgi:hypothetical protein